MDPEETFVSCVPRALPDGTTCVLVKELADHGLSDGMNDGRVRCSMMVGCPLWVDIRSRLADTTSSPNLSQTIWQWLSSMGEFGEGRDLSES